MTKWIRYFMDDIEELIPLRRVKCIEVIDFEEYQNLYIFLDGDDEDLEYSASHEEMGGLMYSLLEWLANPDDAVFAIPKE